MSTVVLLGCGHTAPTTITVGGEKWNLVWQDEFDGAAGQSPDATKWTYDEGTGQGGWGNNQLEFDTKRPQNVALDGSGNLKLTALKEDYQGSHYTSARILTRGLFEHALGRYEARIKLPKGRGLWPAFWLLGADVGTEGWPACGEIDIMELKGEAPNAAHGSLHGPGYSGGEAKTAVWFSDEKGPDFTQDFHVFAIEWDPSRIAFSVDGNTYEVVTPAQVGDKKWVFNHPFFVLLNLAVGGNYVAAPDASTPFPAEMLVDYVRVYERAP